MKWNKKLLKKFKKIFLMGFILVILFLVTLYISLYLDSLRDSPPLKIKVLSHSNAPLKGAKVILSQSGKSLASGRTDKTGLVQLAMPPSGVYRILVKKEGYRPADQDYTPKLISTPVQFVLFKRKEEAFQKLYISGNLENFQGVPLSAGAVFLRELGGDKQVQTRADTRGHFQFSSISPGLYRLTARYQHRSSLSRTLLLDGTRDIYGFTLTFPKVASLKGRFSLSVLPQACKIFIFNLHTERALVRRPSLNAKGEFFLENLDWGQSLVVALFPKIGLSFSKKCSMETKTSLVFSPQKKKFFSLVCQVQNPLGTPVKISLYRSPLYPIEPSELLWKTREGKGELAYIEEGDYLLSVTAKGASPFWREVEVNRTLSFHVKLSPLLKIRLAKGSAFRKILWKHEGPLTQYFLTSKGTETVLRPSGCYKLYFFGNSGCFQMEKILSKNQTLILQK